MDVTTFVRTHPVSTYFGIAYLVPALGFLALVGPKLSRGEAMQSTDALILFPIMELGVCLAGLALTRIVDGQRGLRELFSRIGRWRVGVRWYVPILIPPVLISMVLVTLGALVSPVFAPKIFPIGILFGIVAGLFEEVGWTGYAFPKLRGMRSLLGDGLVLGVLWGLWHLPVVDFLGAASPHGSAWLPFFLAFLGVLMAMRVLIVWIYSHTESVLLAQFMHASSTGFLVVLSPVHVSPAQEALWYAIYAAALWVAVALVGTASGKSFVQRPIQHVARRATIN